MYIPVTLYTKSPSFGVSKTIKISDKNYSLLAEFAGKLQTTLRKPVSMDEALSQLLEKEDIMNLAGSWDLSDEEAENLKKEIEELWSEWRA
jgi:predicted CopG family antitoxin